MENYSKCELQDPLFLTCFVVHYTNHHMPCLVGLLTVVLYTNAVHYTKVSTYLIYTLLLLLTVPMWSQLQPPSHGLGNIAQENTVTDILVEDQLKTHLDLVTVSQKRELYKPNSRTEDMWVIR